MGITSTRRRFLRATLGSCASVATLRSFGEEGRPAQYTAAVIGCTGRGNYGHDHDLVFSSRPDVRVLAVADPDGTGRAKAAERSGAARQYADYREMLEKEKPQLVAVAPRWTDQHHAMAMAALKAGAHVWIEKPLTQTLAEADELLMLAQQRALRIAVAHQMRRASSILHLKKALGEGLIGDLVTMHSHGKQDHRAGGEDLIVLGIHLFDLMRLFAGDPLWCTARVLQGGRDIDPTDAHEATENIGPIAGDDITAQFAFPNGVDATFTSRAQARETLGPWGMDLVGTRGTVRILADIVPRLFQLRAGTWSAQGRGDTWHHVPGDPMLDATAVEKSVQSGNARVADDWLEAIARDREPACSGYAGMKALEMAMAVFEAGLTGKRVPFPVKNRNHPLRGA